VFEHSLIDVIYSLMAVILFIIINAIVFF
jgi:hypothetical protein